MKKYDIAINITLHNEGDLVYKTFRSIALNIDSIKNDFPKIGLQLNVALDNPDDNTKDFFRKSRHLLQDKVDDTNVFTTSFGDPSLGRNYLIEHSSAKYIQIYDGDDLFSRRYLSLMYRAALLAKKPVVVVPEFMLDMDEWTGLLYTRIHKYWSSNDPRQSLTNLYSQNIYQSHIFVDSDIFQKVKYTPNGSDYRYEDYQILMAIIAAGYNIIIARNTMRLYRRKVCGSVLMQHDVNSKLCLAPTKYFSPTVFAKLKHIAANDFDENKYNSWAIQRSSLNNYPAELYLKTYSSHARNILLHGKLVLVELAKSMISACRMAEKSLGIQKQSPREEQTLTDENLNRLYDHGFGAEMFNDIRMLNSIEPLAIYNKNSFINSVGVIPITHPNGLDDVYYRLCRIKDIDRTTDLLLIPHITKGGADKAMINLCEALSKAGRRVLVIATTMNEPNIWEDKLTAIKGVIFLKRDEFFNSENINDNDLVVMLLRIVQNWSNLQTLTVMNSGVGYNLINEWHRELAKFVKIIVHSWAYYINEFGLLGEPFILSKVYGCLDYLITDGEQYKKQLMDINQWDGMKIKPIYLPIRHIDQKTDYSIKRRIMYAGRFDSHKRIDLVLASWGELAKQNIEMVFYGSVDKSDTAYDFAKDMETINLASNARLGGAFNDFNKLPFNDVDLLILPTQSEGMPNIILEALKANLFVISGEAGSIPDIVKDYKNGFIVKDNGNPEAYKKAILEFYNNQNEILDPLARGKFNKSMLRRHGDDVYQNSIKEVYSE